MVALGTFFVALVLSLIFTRIAALALAKTGLSLQVARFQARSAFTGAGFTTTESDKVVTHPVRRKIVSVLLLIGNAGLVTAVATLVLTFLNRSDESSMILRFVVLAVGLLLFWFLSRSSILERLTYSWVEKALDKYSGLETKDYTDLLHLKNNFTISRLNVKRHGWLIGKTLGESRLLDEGVMVMGIERSKGQYVGVPNKHTEVQEDDVLLVYGQRSSIEELEDRPEGHAGDEKHDEAVDEERDRRSHQEEKERDYEEKKHKED